MNKATILVSAVLGLFLGASIGIVQAQETPVTTPVIEVPVAPAAHSDNAETLEFLQEVTIVGTRPAPHAVPSVKAKATTKEYRCTVRNLQMESGNPVRTCAWE
jgi:hypothetical protein